METVCCFTGHRELPEGEKLEKLRKELLFRVTGLAATGFHTFITGGAVGFDMLAANTVLEVKEIFPHIKLIVALPCKEYDKYWSDGEKNAQKKILEKADEIILVSQQYFTGCMHKRNRYIIDAADYCIAYLNKKQSGTYYAVNEARRKGIGVLNLNKYL